MKKVTSIVLNNFKNDSRVLKENILLAYQNNIEFNKDNSKLDLYGYGTASVNIVYTLI